jgi:hypothetical protein
MKAEAGEPISITSRYYNITYEENCDGREDKD